jgi:hypothetical protein
VVQGGDSAGFVFETFGELVLGDFDGDDAVQAGVPGAVDFAHAACADGREDLIRAKFVAGRKRHVLDSA